MKIIEGDKIKLNPKTGKGKQVINRDGSLFKVNDFSETVMFDDGKDWILLNSIHNPKNVRWIQRFHDKDFEWDNI